jgi:hypothetical protein
MGCMGSLGTEMWTFIEPKRRVLQEQSGADCDSLGPDISYGPNVVLHEALGFPLHRTSE